MKYLSLILILLFITIISSFTGCCCNREGLDNKDAMIAGGYVNVGSRPGNCAPSIIPGNNNFTSQELASQFCFDWNQKGGTPSCTAIQKGKNGSFQARGCSSDAIQKGWCKGFPKVTFQEETCNVEQGGTTWFYKKPDKPPPLSASSPPPTTFHPPAPPPHAPWNIDQHIAHIQNPIIGHGEFNTPLPSENAIFIKRQNTNITLNPAPAPKQ